jgi:hypothetical protein
MVIPWVIPMLWRIFGYVVCMLRVTSNKTKITITSLVVVRSYPPTPSAYSSTLASGVALLLRWDEFIDERRTVRSPSPLTPLLSVSSRFNFTHTQPLHGRVAYRKKSHPVARQVVRRSEEDLGGVVHSYAP